MTAILHATVLAHYASTAAFVGLAVTLVLGCFIIVSHPPAGAPSRIVGATRRRLSSSPPRRERNIRGGIKCSAALTLFSSFF
jgi:hypothetical protein